MSIEQAIDLIKQVGSAFKGNLQDHMAIQGAIKVIEEKINTGTEKQTEEKGQG